MKNKMMMDIRTEKKVMVLLDTVICLICCGVIMLPLAGRAVIGYKSFCCMNLLFSCGVMLFLRALEEYKWLITEFQERAVSLTLASVYSFLVVAIANLVFFASIELLGMQAVLAAFTFASLLAANYTFFRMEKSGKYFKRPKMLIIEGCEGEITRSKRVKYGTFAQYDSWYEPLLSEDEEYVQSFLNEKIHDFDAICAFDSVRDHTYDMIVKKAMEYNKDLYIVPRLTDLNRSKANFVRFDDVLAYYMPKYSLSAIEEFFKRAFDLVVAAVGGVIAAIPMAVIAAAIKITSPGPVLYKQKRLTKNKKEFYIYKFRTMVPDAEKLSGPVFAQKDDPRITKIGAVLRSCRLDELPQIFNILKGDMSIVGPRPERPFFVEQFEKEIDNYNYRFVVKAGLTSLSHVYGRYSTYIHDRTCYDLLYITNYSLLMDLKILLLTTKTMFIKKSAEGQEEFELQKSPQLVLK